MNFRERINEVSLKSGCAAVELAVFAFSAYMRKHPNDVPKPVNADTKDFFSDESPFGKFLLADAEEDVILSGFTEVRKHEDDMELSNRLIRRGEQLIREGYRIAARRRIVKPYDVIGGYPVTHGVSLLGVYDEKDDFDEPTEEVVE